MYSRIFLYFHVSFLGNYYDYRGILIFYVEFSYFLIKKMLSECAKHTTMSRWCQCFLENELDATWWPNLTFYHLFICAIVSFSHKVWRVKVYDGQIIIDGRLFFFLSFLFAFRYDLLFFFILFPLLPNKMHDFPLCFWLFNFSPRSFDFLFHSYSCYWSFFFQFSSLIIISHIYFFYSILIHLIFFSWLFY